jgi:hypothetical protein
MPPAVVFLELDIELPVYRHRADEEEDGAVGGESWDEDLLIPGRMVYVGQGQAQFVRVDEPDPGLLYPRRKKKKKKKKSQSSPPEPAPAPASPAPIDWGDWDEICQFGPPPTPPSPVPVWEFPYEGLCLAAPVPTPWEPEDWEAEIAASQWVPEDWEPEICPPSPREDWEPEICPPSPREDWMAELWH